MSIETRISCGGATDIDCSGWDHCVTLSFRCAAAGKNKNSRGYDLVTDLANVSIIIL